MIKKKKNDKLSLGFLLGLLTPAVGFVIYGVYWAWRFQKTFSYFVTDLFIGIPTFRSSILALCLVFNLVPFFIFVRSERYKSARGVLAAVFLFVPFVVYYRFYI